MDEKKVEKLVDAISDIAAEASPADQDANLQVIDAVGEVAAGVLGFVVGHLVGKVGADRAEVLITQIVAFLRSVDPSTSV